MFNFFKVHWKIIYTLMFLFSFALTLLAVSLCGRHDSGGRSWDGNRCRGNHRPDAGTGRRLATRGGAWLVARRWSTWGGADVGSGRFRHAGADEETVKKCYYRFLNFEKCTCIVYLHLFRMFSGVCACVYVFIGYLPLSWAGLFRDICLWSVDLAWSPT